MAAVLATEVTPSIATMNAPMGSLVGIPVPVRQCGVDGGAMWAPVVVVPAQGAQGQQVLEHAAVRQQMLMWQQHQQLLPQTGRQ